MKNKQFYISALILILFILAGCYPKKRENRTNSGNSSISKGPWIDTLYYDDGRIFSIEEYVDTIRNGNYLEFYKNGKLYRHLHFRNGRLYGKCMEYFDNGKIADNFIENDGIIMGSKFKYYENGSLKEYWLYDLKGRGYYCRKYDTAMNPIYTDGSLIANFNSIFKDSNYSVKDSVKFYMVLATPPDCKVKITFGDSLNKFSPVDLTDLLDESTITYRHKFDRPGNYYIYVKEDLLKNNQIIKSARRTIDFTLK